MECLEVSDGDADSRGNLGCAPVSTLLAVDQPGSFTPGNIASIVVATQDAGNFFLLRQLQFSRVKLGVQQQVHDQLQHLVAVTLQA